MTRHHKKKFPAFLWHRRLGLLLVAFIIMLAVTGIMLNHTDDLQLSHHRVNNALVLSLYEINPGQPPISYRTKQHVISQWDHQIYFDNRKLLNDSQQLRGVINTADIIIAVLSQDVLLLSPEGQLIDRYAMDHTLEKQTEIEHIGLFQNQVIIKMMDQSLWQADEDIINWQVTGLKHIEWAAPVQLSSALEEQLLKQYRGEGLPLERIVLDIHSGRIFGIIGVYLMDIAALIMIFLSLSGLWMWWKRGLKQRNKQPRKKKDYS
ncbi:hypothetical protein MNBD_GAMMA11-2473 [hydrothermal vent metagenome]|uniref:PepSY domain-containing protein n=1 Tax=hydrothermal vent metagenome TaxID=652676 RepID=A0A3B0X533_9ZZZZ